MRLEACDPRLEEEGKAAPRLAVFAQVSSPRSQAPGLKPFPLAEATCLDAFLKA
jgi:hypothetical protein